MNSSDNIDLLLFSKCNILASFQMSQCHYFCWSTFITIQILWAVASQVCTVKSLEIRVMQGEEWTQPRGCLQQIILMETRDGMYNTSKNRPSQWSETLTSESKNKKSSPLPNSISAIWDI